MNHGNYFITLKFIKFFKSKEIMNKNTGALLRDIRNIKRNTTMFPSPQDIITSAK
jgi:hypothetical protein